MKFLLVDFQNMMHRARWAVRGDVFLKSGLAMHVVFSSIAWAWQKFEADHVIFVGEGRSWRKDYYKAYKANRSSKDHLKSQTEIEEDKIFYQTIDEFTAFIKDSTNCTFLQHDRCEADDLIARWIQLFQSNPENQFIILSTDTDFQQLIAPNVEIYDGVNKKWIRNDGIYDEKGNPVFDKKGEKLPAPDAEYILFKKCIRGDGTDNITSAYPGVREKGTKDKVGILEAFEDRVNKGLKWNSFMMQSWSDPFGKTYVVKDAYEYNKMLIDLTQQPDEVKDLMDSVILDKIENPPNKTMIGPAFLKFCGKHELVKVAERSGHYLPFLNSAFKE